MGHTLLEMQSSATGNMQLQNVTRNSFSLKLQIIFYQPAKSSLRPDIFAGCRLLNTSLMIREFFLHQNLSCSSDSLLYIINCKRCLNKDGTLPSRYIGQSESTLRERFGEQRRGIQRNTDESVPIHFNPSTTPIPVLKIKSRTDSYRYTMEQHLISDAETLTNGPRIIDHNIKR